MSDKVFVDTNILIYTNDRDAGAKHEVCRVALRDIWASGAGVISTQVMQAFNVIVPHKLAKRLDPQTARGILRTYATW